MRYGEEINQLISVHICTAQRHKQQCAEGLGRGIEWGREGQGEKKGKQLLLIDLPYVYVHLYIFYKINGIKYRLFYNLIMQQCIANIFAYTHITITKIFTKL